MDALAELSLAWLADYGSDLIKSVGIIGGLVLLVWLATDDDSEREPNS